MCLNANQIKSTPVEKSLKAYLRAGVKSTAKGMTGMNLAFK